MKRIDSNGMNHTAQAYLNNLVEIRNVAPVCAGCGGADPDGGQIVSGSCGSACGAGDQ